MSKNVISKPSETQSGKIESTETKKVGLREFIDDCKLLLSSGPLDFPLVRDNPKGEKEIIHISICKFFYDEWSGVPMVGCHRDGSLFSANLISFYENEGCNSFIDAYSGILEQIIHKS